MNKENCALSCWWNNSKCRKVCNYMYMSQLFTPRCCKHNSGIVQRVLFFCGLYTHVLPRHGASTGWGWQRRPSDMEDSWEYINKKLLTADKGRCSTFGVFYEEPKSHRLKRHQPMAFRVSDLDSCFGTTLTKEKISMLELWNVRSLYRSGLLYTRADEP